MSGKYSIHPMEAMARGITPKPPLSDDACELEKNPIMCGTVVRTWRTAMSSSRLVEHGSRREHMIFCAGMLHLLSIQQAATGASDWPEIGFLCDILSGALIMEICE